MQYKVSFFLTLLGQLLTSFSAFLGVYFLFARFNEIDGYTYQEVLLCLGVVLMAFSIAECFARGFDQFPSMISNGEFDRIMVRPRNEIFQILAAKMAFTRLGRCLQAMIIFVYAIPASGVDWTPIRILTLILMLIAGTAIFAGLFVIYAAICFFTIEGLEFMNIFTDGGREFGQYPFSVYGKPVLLFFTFVIPLALFQYYPFLYLIGHTTNIVYALLPLASLLFLLPCWLLWKLGVRKYQSTGS